MLRIACYNIVTIPAISIRTKINMTYMYTAFVYCAQAKKHTANICSYLASLFRSLVSLPSEYKLIHVTMSCLHLLIWELITPTQLHGRFI